MAALGLVITAGCGTTVPLAEQNANGGGSLAQGSSGNSAQAGTGLGTNTPGSGNGGSVGSGSGAGGSASGNLSGGGAGGGGATGAGSSANPDSSTTLAGASTSVNPALNGPGVTDSTITIGEEYSSSASAADNALGAAGLSQGDAVTQFKAIANYINAHGGIAHRQVKLSFYDVNVAQSQTQADQEACSAFTQDTKTFVLLSGTPGRDQCAAKEGGIGIDEAFVQETGQTLQQYPSDLNLDGFTIDRSMQITVQGLAAQGYFSTSAKVGVATWDSSDYHSSLVNSALPALARAGVRNPAQAFITVPSSESDLGATSAAIGNAVLKFHAAGIDHVILFDGPAGINSAGDLVLEWMNQANTQNWYPKYGLNSTSGFSGLAPDYPAKEMVGSEGVGWVPVTDLSQSDYNALPQSPLQKTCIQVMTAAGQAPTSAQFEGLELDACDQMFFLQQALANVTGPLNQQTALAAVDALGSRFDDLTTFGTFFSASQHDGAELVRNVGFVPSCDCYRYTGPAYNPAA